MAGEPVNHYSPVGSVGEWWAWIQTAAGKSIFSIAISTHVQRTIVEAQQGIQRHDYGQQPAYGFSQRHLFGRDAILYPTLRSARVDCQSQAAGRDLSTKLKERILAHSSWSAEFTLRHARSFAEGTLTTQWAVLTRAVTI